MTPEYYMYKDILKLLLDNNVISNNKYNKYIKKIENSTGYEEIKQIYRNKITESLNDEQLEAFNEIDKYVTEDTGNNYLILKGVAGSGKTYMINKWIEYHKRVYPYGSIAVSAPTNKAVKVLRSDQPKDVLNGSCIESYVSYKTVHSLLGIKEHIDNNGKITFVPTEKDIEQTNSFDAIIIDECSMVGKELFGIIKNVTTKLIFMGDRFQIPPVNEQNSILFQENTLRVNEIRLEKIMRQKEGSPIIAKSKEIRDNILHVDPIKDKTTMETSEGSVFYYTDKREALEQLGALIDNGAYKNPKDFKVIAWRNKTLANCNNYIRERIYGKNPKVLEEGDVVVACSTLYNLDGEIKATNSDEFVVSGIVRNQILYKIEHKRYHINYDINISGYMCKGTNIITNEVIKLFITDDEGKKQLSRYTAPLKKLCIEKKDASLWSVYYKTLNLNDHVAYAYCCSVHKAQGSTYKNVFLVENDINRNDDIFERNRIKYTAYTRAKENLYVVL